MKNNLILLLFCSFSNVLLAQQDIVIANYMPAKGGDSLFFQNAIQTKAPAITVFYLPTEIHKQAALQRQESIGITRTEIRDEKGLQLLLLRMPDGRELLLDKPLRMLPPKVDANRTYRDTVRYTLLREGAKIGNGILQSEITVEGSISAETPLRNFANCLVISCQFVQKPLSGTVEFYEAKEWYASGVGLVKSFIKTYKYDLSGKPANMQSYAILLQKALQDGKWLDGKEVKN